jgi:integrase
MITQHKRGRTRTGSILVRKNKAGKKTEIFARVTYFRVDQKTGELKRKDVRRHADNRAAARDLIKDMLRDLDDHGETALDHHRKSFADLADHYEEHYLTEAEYIDGKKVSGLRSLDTQKRFLQTLRGAFGKQLLSSITYGQLRKFRSARLKAPTRNDLARHREALDRYHKALKRKIKSAVKPELRVTRSIASVNRELAMLRRMFNVAQREGWLRRNPMNSGESLISVADEHKRERIITLDEETRLLAACEGDRREHLRPIVIAALETGMRKGELLKMKWSDIDFNNRLITVQAFNTKTMRQREVGMSARLTVELERLWKKSDKDATALVFGITDNVKRSFHAARCAAGLPDVRFHDLRHTYATRLVSLHIPLPEVGRVLGHAQANTTYRYVNANSDTARRTAIALDSLREVNQVQQSDGMIN